MKKILSFVLAVSAISVLSCTKEIATQDVETPEVPTIDITIRATEKPAVEAGTKTYLDGATVKWSASGEYLKLFEVATPTEGEAVTSIVKTAEGSPVGGGATMTFGATLDEKSSGYTSFDYYAVYPFSAVHGDPSVATAVAVNTKAAQTPSSTSFDPTQDLLLGKLTGQGTQKDNLEMSFARVVAVGKMTIKNLESSDDITKITFSAKVGAEPVILAGRTNFNLTTGNPVSTYGSNTQDYSIILDYDGQGIKANSSMTAYFTCYPFAINSVTPGSFKVIVETATQTFTKEVNVSSAKGLAFNIGEASTFSVDMDGIAGEAKAVNLCYAYLVPSDVSLGASYGNVSVTKTHGDAWSMFAINASGNIGVRRNDDGSNDSYIKLPDFVENIKTVVVTLNTPASGKTITLESSATGTGGAIASLTTSAATVYTFDLTSGPSVKTAYFRASGAQAKVEKIEVYAGTDTRSAIAAPASVTAALNGSTANSIDVSWSEVDGAGGYIITLVPDSGDDVVVKAASSPYTVTDLAYNMEYLVSVQAEPADYYLKTISAETTASDVVTTGSNSSGVVALTESEITMGSNTVKGTENGKLAYRLGTSSNDGSLTFDAGYSSITFTLAGWASGTRSFSITNGKIAGSSSLSPSVGTPSGTISANFSRTDSGTEYTIVVDDPSEEVVFTGHRAIVWGFTAVEYVAPAVAAPTFSVAEGTYNAAQSVTLSCATGGASIYYTTDGSTPTSGSTLYSTAIPVNVSMTIKAIAIKATDESAIASATYTLKVATPTFSPAAGSYGSAQNVTISCATGDATIHYTTDGTDPTAGSPTYSSAITVSSTQTIKAIAIKTGWTNSDVASAAYNIGGGGGTASFAPSDFSGQGTSGTGGYISATVDGVTFACDKGYGTTQIRCYSGSTITISSSKTITAIRFTFSGSYTGGMETSYTSLNTTSWTKATSSQARITSIEVDYSN